MEVVVSPMKMPVVPKASPDVLPELATYLAPFAPLFVRQASLARWERRSQAITLKFEHGTQQVQVLPNHVLPAERVV